MLVLLCHAGVEMAVTSVTSKGQVTIPKNVRQRLGIRQGSRIALLVVGDHIEMRVESTPAASAQVDSAC